ncbi:hypothetical protein L596_004783 [Steinernema carpocapsae]|uniref:Bestrophin homolog n=1 Tax=Steinernema carpocapsae TaxID=34508 RepID=A0A4U8UWV2_STECR|nr:hypothetical protein L596_004783 [Steinernema carpocapsae]
MTVTYTGDVANANIKAFLKTIFRWKGSVWKAVYLELIIWSLAYALLSVIYRNALTEDQRDLFEKVALFCYKYGDFIPLTFMLGFYVNLVVQRWMKMFHNLGWIDDVALMAASYIQGIDEKSRMIRRCIVRYLCLVQVMVFRAISIGIRKRFPTFDTLVASGYITATERGSLGESQFYLPARWAMTLIKKAREEGRIHSDQAVQDLFNEICDFRTRVVSLWLFDWVPVPLVYTQVVFLTVRVYFILAIMGRQYIDVDKHPIRGPVDAYVPFFTVLQFTFYVGWMKVAEALLNPFGDDDDDFECNWVIDRNLQAGMAIVDGDGEQPDACVDKFWDDQHGIFHMYTAETVNQPQNPIRGSAVDAMDSKIRSNEAIIMVPRPMQSAENLESPTVVVSRKNSVSSNFASRLAGSLRSAFGSSMQLDKKVLSLSRIPESSHEDSFKSNNGALQEARKRRSSVNVAEISAQQLKDQTKPTPFASINSKRRFSDPEKTGGLLAAVDEIDEQQSSASDENSPKEPKRAEAETNPFCISAGADCYASMSLSPESSEEGDDDDKQRAKDEKAPFKEEECGRKKFF